MTTDVGAVTHEDGLHIAQCAKCPEQFKSTKDGQAAHELMEHNQEVHVSGNHA